MLTVKYVFVVFGYLTRMCYLFGNATGSSVCDRNGHILKCSGYIPLNVSKGITSVFLTNLPQGEALTNLTFVGFGWDGIEALNIKKIGNLLKALFSNSEPIVFRDYLI